MVFRVHRFIPSTRHSIPACSHPVLTRVCRGENPEGCLYPMRASDPEPAGKAMSRRPGR